MKLPLSPTVFALATLGALAQTPQRPVFQVGTDSVVLDIAVRHNDEPVLGLSQTDFEISDNGVPQAIDHMTAETFPLDLTLLIDESGYGQTVIDQIRSAAGATADLLADDDKLRVVTFNARIQQRYEGSAAGADAALDSIEAAGRTSLYDAIAAALMRRRNPDRRALIVGFTMGLDTTSTTNPAILKDVAQRADVVLDVFLAYNPDHPLAGRTQEFDPHVREAAEVTGGFMQEMLGDEALTDRLRKALLDFRARYMLSYTIKGVARPGWHDVTVKIKGHNDYKVLVRRGYDGGK